MNKKVKIKSQCNCRERVTEYIWNAPIGEKRSFPLRSPDELLERLEWFRKNRGVKSMNQLIVGLLMKACDDEGV